MKRWGVIAVACLLPLAAAAEGMGEFGMPQAPKKEAPKKNKKKQNEPRPNDAKIITPNTEPLGYEASEKEFIDSLYGDNATVSIGSSLYPAGSIFHHSFFKVTDKSSGCDVHVLWLRFAWTSLRGSLSEIEISIREPNGEPQIINWKRAYSLVSREPSGDTGIIKTDYIVPPGSGDPRNGERNSYIVVVNYKTQADSLGDKIAGALFTNNSSSCGNMNGITKFVQVSTVVANRP